MVQHVIEVSAVQTVLQDYIYGVLDGDIERVKGTFHPNAVMNGYMNGHLVAGSPEPFFNDVENGPSQSSLGKGYQGRILLISVYGQSATAVVAEDQICVGHPDGSRPVMDIIDSFHLLKIDGRWLIVSKLFHHDPL